MFVFSISVAYLESACYFLLGHVAWVDAETTQVIVRQLVDVDLPLARLQSDRPVRHHLEVVAV